MRVPAWFSDAYAPAEVPLLARLETTRALLQRLDLVELHAADTIDPRQLDGLHALNEAGPFIGRITVKVEQVGRQRRHTRC